MAFFLSVPNHFHYGDVIMSTMTSLITSVSIVYSTICSGEDERKHQKLRVTGLCEGNSPVTGEFPAQWASNEENVSIHDVIMSLSCDNLSWIRPQITSYVYYIDIPAKTHWNAFLVVMLLSIMLVISNVFENSIFKTADAFPWARHTQPPGNFKSEKDWISLWK